MATKKTKAAPTDDELNKLLEGIGEDDAPAQGPPKGPSKTKKPAPTQSEEDMLAELENLGAEKPTSRPHTPRVQAAVGHAARSSPVKRSTATPPPTSTRNSEDKTTAPRKSAESTRSFHTSFTPSATSSDLQDAEKKAPVAQPAEATAPGGGWWGSVFTAASAAVKTAEAAVKEIQKNEEAQRWAEQVKGNVGALKGLGSFALIWPLIHSINPSRRRVEIKSIAHFHEHSPYSRTSYLISREIADPYYTRLHRLPLTRSAYIFYILSGHGTGRRR